MGRHTHPFVNTATEDAWITYMTTPSYKGCREMPSKQPCAQVQAPLLYKREKQVYEGNSAFLSPSREGKKNTVKYICKAGECGTQWATPHRS